MPGAGPAQLPPLLKLLRWLGWSCNATLRLPAARVLLERAPALEELEIGWDENAITAAARKVLQAAGVEVSN